MEKHGFAFAHAYWYHDDKSTINLNWLSVSESSRKKGIGTELQEIREEIGRKLGASVSSLQVEKGSWMHDWYKRRGYEYLREDDNDNNLVWMSKTL
jgi:GNAT superfamily N-acetyltransferase